MPTKPNRDNAYFLGRLERDHPKIYAELLAGAYPSVRAASLAAGIIKLRRRVSELTNAFDKATPDERPEFYIWMQAGYRRTMTDNRIVPASASSATAIPTLAGPKLSSPLTADRRLQSWAITRIDQILSRRAITVCVAMGEMGGSRRDISLRGALSSGQKLNAIDETALTEWISRQSVSLGLAWMRL